MANRIKPSASNLSNPFSALRPIRGLHVTQAMANTQPLPAPHQSVEVIGGGKDKLKRECLRTKDDGSVALDWVSGDLLSPDSPLLVLLESQNSPLAGAVSLCNPFNLVAADENFQKGFNIVYDRALANSLRKILMRHALLFEDLGGEYNIPAAANTNSVREFDEALTRGKCPMNFLFLSADKWGQADYVYHLLA